MYNVSNIWQEILIRTYTFICQRASHVLSSHSSRHKSRSQHRTGKEDGNTHEGLDYSCRQCFSNEKICSQGQMLRKG